MRLIDADALERMIKNEYCIVVDGQLKVRTEDGGLKPLLPMMPTAYDVEAVQECEDKTDYANIELYAFWQKHQWIPCSERLPEDEGKKYIVQKTNGFIDILGFTKDAYKLSRFDFYEYKGKKQSVFYEWDSEYGYIDWECEAWQPLPDHYKQIN